MYVFDTSIWVAALRSRNGASFRLLRALGEGRISGAASVALMLEYEDVLRRDANLRHFWAAPSEITVVLGMLAARLRPVSIHFQWRSQLRDADDELVLECAVNARARTIVTFNKADFDPMVARFGIEAIFPADVLRREKLGAGGPT